MEDTPEKLVFVAPNPEGGPQIPELLGEGDLPWLTGFIGDAEQAAASLETLQKLATVGGEPLSKTQPLETRQVAIAARIEFMHVLGVTDELIGRSTSDSTKRVVPLMTFITSQRYLHRIGVTQPMRLITNDPRSITRSPAAWKNAYELIESTPEFNRPGKPLNLTLLSRVCSTMSKLPAEEVRTRIQALHSLGIVPATLVKQPNLIQLGPHRAKARLDALEALGFNAAAIANSAPAILSMQPKRIAEKFIVLSKAGVDPVKVARVHPKALTLSAKNIEAKIRLLHRGAKALQWEGDVSRLIEYSPNALSTSPTKLLLMMRIAAKGAHPSRRKMTPQETRTALITPLPAYIIALGDTALKPSHPSTDVVARGKEISNSYSPTERVQWAKVIASMRRSSPKMGKIAAGYLDYIAK